MNEKLTMLKHITEPEKEIQELKISNEYLRDKISQLSKLEQEIQQLKISNEYAWQKNRKLNERIQSLIKLGLETTRPDGLAEWHEEEEL